MAISWFNSLSSTKRIRPERSLAGVVLTCFSALGAWIIERKQFLRSDKNNGLLQNPVTPASFASSSISDQSYAVNTIIGTFSLVSFRIRRATSIPFISGSSQSII